PTDDGRCTCRNRVPDDSQRGEAAADRVLDERGVSARPELAHRVGAVTLHGGDAHEEPGRDLGWATPFADQLQDLALPGAQQRPILAWLEQPGGEQPGNGRREVALVPGD